MDDETMLARIPASRRLAWRLADALSLMAHGQQLGSIEHFGLGRPESLPLADPERRHALYEASCTLESAGAIEVEPLLHAIEALLGEHRDMCNRAIDLVEELDRTTAWRHLLDVARREHSEARRELRRSVGVPDDLDFPSPQEEWAHVLDRVAALRHLASVAATRDAEAAAVSTDAGPAKNVWELLREDA